MTIICFSETAPEILRQTAAEFGIAAASQPPQTGEYLLAGSDGISLCRAGEKGRVQADFVSGAAQYRRIKGGGELIAKAVNHTARPTVWDGTGGLGRDSFVLATLGLTVHTFEQNPAVALLLSDGLRRACEAGGSIAEIAGRITLHFGDTCTLIPELATRSRPDIVYLDPMYPERQKSAAVKKEMAYFHGLVGSAQNEAGLLNTARAAAKKRIVVKRPRLGEFLNNEKPAYQYTGKSTRFDIYLPDFPEKD